MTAARPPIHPRPEEPAVRALLAAAGLPVADLTAAHLADFWGCGDGANPIGVVGLEVYGTVALLRSLAVAPDEQGRGLGSALRAHAERAARQRGIAALYLLTTTAEAFFVQRGYVRIPREAAPPVLHRTAEFAALCPASAVCMTRTLATPVADRPAQRRDEGGVSATGESSTGAGELASRRAVGVGRRCRLPRRTSRS